MSKQVVVGKGFFAQSTLGKGYEPTADGIKVAARCNTAAQEAYAAGQEAVATGGQNLTNGTKVCARVVKVVAKMAEKRGKSAPKTSWFKSLKASVGGHKYTAKQADELIKAIKANIQD